MFHLPLFLVLHVIQVLLVILVISLLDVVIHLVRLLLPDEFQSEKIPSLSLNLNIHMYYHRFHRAQLRQRSDQVNGVDV